MCWCFWPYEPSLAPMGCPSGLVGNLVIWIGPKEVLIQEVHRGCFHTVYVVPGLAEGRRESGQSRFLQCLCGPFACNPVVSMTEACQSGS